MKIEHVALWSRDIERLKSFYVKYFGGTAGKKYINSKKQFESYFIAFDSGARLELMQMPAIAENFGSEADQYIGLTHFAFSTSSREAVNNLTEALRNAGYEVISEPRTTGDSYYESCILDPEGNMVEIVS